MNAWCVCVCVFVYMFVLTHIHTLLGSSLFSYNHRRPDLSALSPFDDVIWKVPTQ